MNACSRVSECQIAVESDHRIANHMAMLASYIRLRRGEFLKQPEGQDSHEILRLVDGIFAQVAAVSELHRMLTARASSPSSDIGAQLARICAAFRNGPACETVIDYSGEPDCILPVNHILPVSQIVSEVMTNALKYGHKAGCAGSIRIGCHRADGNHIIISVDDDGDGMLPDSSGGTKPQGIGVAMVAGLVRQINGTIEYKSSDRGLSFSLSLCAAERAMPALVPFVDQVDWVSS